MKQVGVTIPKCFAMADKRDADGKIVRSTFLLEYLDNDHYHQHQDLTFEQAKVALTALAKFHGFYWQNGGSVEAGRRLFERGGWWRRELRASVKFHTMAESFRSLCTNFTEDFNDIDTKQSHALIQKLQDIVDEIGKHSKG